MVADPEKAFDESCVLFFLKKWDYPPFLYDIFVLPTLYAACTGGNISESDKKGDIMPHFFLIPLSPNG